MKKVIAFFDRIEEQQAIRAIRRGLVLTIPLLMIGSFALVLNILPIPAYQAFIHGAGVEISRFLDTINGVTFGILSLAITITVATSYTRFRHNQTSITVGAVFSSLCVYAIFIGLFNEDFTMASLGAAGTFTALFSALVGSAVYCRLVEKNWFSVRIYSVGANYDFNSMVSVIIPIIIVIILGYAVDWLLAFFFQASSFEVLFHNATFALFGLFRSISAKAVLYIFLSNFLWFFGIHGANVLDSVANSVFYAVPGGPALPGFLNKPVLDVFVSMGGSGATFSLLLAILFFSKRKNNTRLAKMAAVPMLFNVNEMLVFGLPIILNVSYLVPFLLVPLVFMAITALALVVGFIPQPHDVQWVMPIFVNGYLSTNSINGVLLQLINLAAGVSIYRFFLLQDERRTNARIKQNMNILVKTLQNAEARGETPVLLDLRGRIGGLAKMMAADLSYELKHNKEMSLYYQPQYDNHDNWIGCEALLRWKHPLGGMVYPPLVVGLALEIGKLVKMERLVFELACKDIEKMNAMGIFPPSISVNATAAALQEDEGFIEFLADLLEKYPGARHVMSIELTEQMSFNMNAQMEERLAAILDMGIHLEVDDFAMGHTSFKYLQSNYFSRVKLDGSLVKNMLENERSEEIISTIVRMSDSMNFKVIAEFVETVEQRDRLQELGCYMYQGYLYSPALPLHKLADRMNNEKNGVTTPRK